MTQPFTFVEIDVDYCGLTFGTAPCTAALGPATQYKCFNTYNTCSSKPNYQRTTKTLRYCQTGSILPNDGIYFPVMTSVSYDSPEVNLSGANRDSKPLGVRGSATVTLADFPYHDRVYDKYEPERYAGSAQYSGVGQDQQFISTHFAKLKARWPFYAGRPLRVVTGTIDDAGNFTHEATRHYVIEDMAGPAQGQSVTIKAKDILKLADDDRAVLPKPSRGKLGEPLEVGIPNPVITLENNAQAEQYEASGWVAIGSEVLRYTGRTGRTLTGVIRAAGGSVAASHSEGATVQQVFAIRGEQAHVLARRLLTDGAGIPLSFIPFSDWRQEVEQWFSNVPLYGFITKPTGVNELLTELSNLGFTIWWDEVSQLIKMRYNRPKWGDEEITDLTEAENIIELSQDDMDTDRVNQVEFRLSTIDVTKSHTDLMNYNIMEVAVDAELAGPNAFNDNRIRQIQSRVLDNGNFAAARIAGQRLLNRFRFAPKKVHVDIDKRDDCNVMDIVRLTSRSLVNADGTPATELYQVIRRQDTTIGAKIKLTLQRYFYSQRYAGIAPDNMTTYQNATFAQRERFVFIGRNGPTNWSGAPFSDGAPPYYLI